MGVVLIDGYLSILLGITCCKNVSIIFAILRNANKEYSGPLGVGVPANFLVQILVT